jgi:inorganic pyrophosphatase
VPLRDPLWNHLRCLSDIPPHLLREIEHFFTVYKDLEKKTGVEGWEDRPAALKAIAGSRRKYEEERK